MSYLWIVVAVLVILAIGLPFIAKGRPVGQQSILGLAFGAVGVAAALLSGFLWVR